MADTSKQCTIANKSGKDAIVIINVPENEISGNGSTLIPGSRMEVLKISDGSTLLKAGTSGTVTLDHSYQSGSDGYVQQYDLQLCDTAWMMPWAVLPVVQQSANGSANYPPQALTAESQSIMSLAFTFYQTVSVHPDSQLAKDYVTALQAAKEASLAKADGSPGAATAAATAMEDTVNRFFENTQSYQKLTLPDVVAVGSYYNAFPFVWARYADSATYYLYGTANNLACFMGTLSLKKSGPVNTTKPAGGYACSFAPAVNQSDIDNSGVDEEAAVPLLYVNGLFTDDPKAQQSKIALRGSFIMQRQFTMDEADNKPAIVISGNINGTLCLGLGSRQRSTNNQQKKTANATTDTGAVIVAYWNTLIHPKTLTDWVVTIMTFAGAVLAIPTMAFAVYQVGKLITRKKVPLLKEDVEKDFNQISDEAYWKTIKWTGDKDSIRSQNIADHYGISIEKVVEITLNDEMMTWTSTISTIQKMCAKELLEYKSVMSAQDGADLDSLFTAIQASERNITSIKTSSIYRDPELMAKRVELLNDELNNAKGYETIYNRIYENMEHKISQDTKELFEEINSKVATYFHDIKTAMDDNSKESSEEDPRVEEEIVPFE